MSFCLLSSSLPSLLPFHPPRSSHLFNSHLRLHTLQSLPLSSISFSPSTTIPHPHHSSHLPLFLISTPASRVPADAPGRSSALGSRSNWGSSTEYAPVTAPNTQCPLPTANTAQHSKSGSHR
ncbi:uncharacterized protein BO72DRAFT_22457 [Aspergillus fijiensis CBS 313.89]|uniref:Uncharacterized protein n=1 Tax=Aspergillus fijiensis CBS 313.89 TaxID=1448319 RepID=A0A8G1RTE9_9EURO|nr:uncharacterized protein BO72DRAFT_22457 [Aspergillus fijiensis CBS 313.89]RAK79837.1 hypothetical protein BO72DRAFT_22457 [Aspergillus fijiensis CBS 313.89]